MAIIRCWNCDRGISNNFDECPKCGAEQSYQKRHPYRHTFSVFVFVLIAFIAMSPLMFFGYLFILSLITH